MLETRNIVKHYGAVKALVDGHLSVAAGEVVALLGANGSGKSTLGKVVTGVVSPTSGELFLEGKQVRFASPYVCSKSGGYGGLSGTKSGARYDRNRKYFFRS